VRPSHEYQLKKHATKVSLHIREFEFYARACIIAPRIVASFAEERLGKARENDKKPKREREYPNQSGPESLIFREYPNQSGHDRLDDGRLMKFQFCLRLEELAISEMIVPQFF
jgi:hypothetical protein